MEKCTFPDISLELPFVSPFILEEFPRLTSDATTCSSIRYHDDEQLQRSHQHSHFASCLDV